MSRVLATLAIVNVLALAGTFGLGLSADATALNEPAGRLFAYHFLAGLFTAVFTLLVHSLVFTYFVGTGRWVKEIAASYPLPPEFADRSSRLKVRSLAGGMLSMLLIIAAVGFGAAADPGASVRFGGWAGLSPAALHLIVSTVAVAVNLVAYVVEFVAVQANTQLIEEVMAVVRRIRIKRGLEEPTFT